MFLSYPVAAMYAMMSIMCILRMKKVLTNKANFEARFCSLFIGVELEGHFVVLGHQLEILWDTGATEPGLQILIVHQHQVLFSY
jgi:hypothetical protein